MSTPDGHSLERSDVEEKEMHALAKPHFPFLFFFPPHPASGDGPRRPVWERRDRVSSSTYGRRRWFDYAHHK